VWSERRTTATGLMMLLLRLHIDLLAGAQLANGKDGLQLPDSSS